MIIRTEIEVSSKAAYLFAEAKKRGIGPEELIRRVVKVVMDLELVDDTLDDDGKVTPPEAVIPESAPIMAKNFERLSLRQCEIDIIARLTLNPQISIAQIEPRESKRMTWYKAADSLCQQGRIIKLPRGSKRDHQYYTLSQVPSNMSPDKADVALPSSPVTEGSGSSIPCADESEFDYATSLQDAE